MKLFCRLLAVVAAGVVSVVVVQRVYRRAYYALGGRYITLPQENSTGAG